MGAGISDQFSHYFGHFFNNRPIVLMVGIAAGFSAIFGTPIAGAVFALEILKIGPNHYKALFPCLVSAFIGFYCGKYLGIHYSHFDINFFPIISISSLLLIIISGLIFGWIARFFLWLLHAVKEILKQKIPKIIFRPFFGGIFIVLIFYLFKTDRYLSLGEDIIHLSFIDHVYPWDFIGKIMTTVISVGSGFRGGEVMSLFYIGATLGNALSYVIPFSISFLSSLGFVSVFSSAANTPIAGIFLAVQVFGIKFGLWAALSIMVAYLVSGKNGLFKSNRKNRYKLH